MKNYPNSVPDPDAKKLSKNSMPTNQEDSRADRQARPLLKDLKDSD